MTDAVTNTTDSTLSSYSSTATNSLDKDAFLTLLVTQIQNQDPFEPVDNTQFVSQLAEFSSLETAEKTNDQLEALTALQQQTYQLTSLSQGAALIGKEVSYYNPETETVESGTVNALTNLEDGVVLNIGEYLVPLSNVVEIKEGSGDSTGT